MRKSRILVIGDSYAELRTDIKRFPSGGETIFGGGYDYNYGGSGFASAIALSRMGAEALCCSRVGDDVFGEKLILSLKQASVDARFVVKKRNTRTRLNVSGVDTFGRTNSLRLSGTCGNIEEEDVEEAFLSYPDAVLIHFDLAPELILKATVLAKEEGIPVFADGGPSNVSVALGELENIAVFMLNENEIHAYTGVAPDSFDSCGRACIELEKKIKAKYYVLKLGDRGAYLYNGKYFKYMPAYDVKTVDESCAGEAFDAAVITEYMRSGNIKRACELGCVAGAMTVMTEGGAESVPTLSRMIRFIEDNEITFEV